jgi:hypothetical protein
VPGPPHSLPGTSTLLHPDINNTVCKREVLFHVREFINLCLFSNDIKLLKNMTFFSNKIPGIGSAQQGERKPPGRSVGWSKYWPSQRLCMIRKKGKNLA